MSEDFFEDEPKSPSPTPDFVEEESESPREAPPPEPKIVEVDKYEIARKARNRQLEQEIEVSKRAGYDVFLKPKVDPLTSKLEIDSSTGSVMMESVLLRSVTNFKPENEKAGWFPILIPISVVINFAVAISAFFLGISTPFVALFILNAMLIMLIFIAGENFWLWVQYWINRKKNWGLVLKRYLNTRKTLHFKKIEEAEEFKYIDDAGQKRVAEVRIRKMDNVSNLGIPLAILQEGYTDSLDLDERYPASKVNRDINQSIIGGVKAGMMMVIDQLAEALGKRPEDIKLYIILGALGILLLLSLYLTYTMPEKLAEAISQGVASAIQTANQPVTVLEGA